MNVLIVEDEKRLADALEQIMKGQKYNADVVYNGTDGLDFALAGDYDVIVLDVMLPGLDGYEVVRRMRRAKNATPVLILTARDDISDKVEGLDAGADDYLTKPFSQDELLARVRALSRRQGEVIVESMTFDGLKLEVGNRRLSYSGRSIQLSHKEAEILKILMASGQSVSAKETLIAKVWGLDSEAVDNTVEAQISFLRKKFAFLGARAGIETVRKAGYRLVGQGAQA